MPFVQESQAAGEATTVHLNLEKQRLDILLIFVVVGVDRGMAHEVGRSGDLALWWCFVVEAESYGVEVPVMMCQYLVAGGRRAELHTARCQADEAEDRIHSLAYGLEQRWASAARRSSWATPEPRETMPKRAKVMLESYLALKFLV